MSSPQPHGATNLRGSMRPFTFLVTGGTIEDVGCCRTRLGPARAAPHVLHLPRITLEWLRGRASAERHRALNGTMVFVDIFGFTAMSERFGAERPASARRR